MKLEVNKYYLDCNKEIVKITNVDDNHNFPFESINGVRYNEQGRWLNYDRNNKDLIMEIPESIYDQFLLGVYNYHSSVPRS